MAKIFISYKRKNKEQVFSIVRYVESRLGIKCWVDLDGIESSVQFASVICRAIDEAEVVLFMHSEAHASIDFENDWTIKELNYAHAKKKRVVLVKLDSTPLDNIFLMEYGSKNNIDSRERMQLERLIADLSHWLGVNARQPEPAKPSSAVNIEKNAVATVAPKPVKGVNASVADCKVYSAEVTVEEAEICRKYIDMVVHHRLDRSKLEEKIEAMAKCGKTEAEYALGFGEYRPYGSNIKVGGDKHYLAAEHWLKKAAGKGHIKAQSLLAEMYYWCKEYDKSIPWAAKASERGDAAAARILAWCYRFTDNTPKYVKALKRAAELQESTGSRDIHCPALEYGEVLLEGRYATQDLKEAIRWFDVAKRLAYEPRISSRACCKKAEALYKQGHKLMALNTLGDCQSEDYQAECLRKKIKAELNPFKKLFK
jgi:hypothetical protein